MPSQMHPNLKAFLWIYLNALKVIWIRPFHSTKHISFDIDMPVALSPIFWFWLFVHCFPYTILLGSFFQSDELRLCLFRLASFGCIVVMFMLGFYFFSAAFVPITTAKLLERGMALLPVWWCANEKQHWTGRCRSTVLESLLSRVHFSYWHNHWRPWLSWQYELLGHMEYFQDRLVVLGIHLYYVCNACCWNSCQ